MTAIRVADYEALARDRLPEPIWDYVAGGSEDERTLKANLSAFGDVRFRPRVLAGVSRLSLDTTVMGTPVQMPMLVAPMGLHRLVHSDGELATARAATAAGSLLVVSTMSSQSLEDVAQATGDSTRGAPWLGLYLFRDREVSRELVHRAEAAGYGAIVLTVDAPCIGRRERDIRHRFTAPSGVRFANFAPNRDDLLSEAGESGSAVAMHASQNFDDGLTWKDLDWLRSITSLPIVVKGVLTSEDACRAADHGVSGILVSNHGGRQLDSSISTLEALPEIAACIGNRVEIYLDGGIRRGTDVLKALALGARAVFVGRPILWGLAVNGEEGARNVLELLRTELEVAMRLAGCPTLADIDRDLVVGGAAAGAVQHLGTR